MMKILISSIMLLLSSMMMFLNHPLSMGLMILTQTLLVCLISGLLIKTYWFSYILFLTFLGGLLVLFIYVSSVASNEMFMTLNINLKLMLSLFMLLLIIFQYIFFYNLNWMNLSNELMDTNNFFDNYFFNNENKININKLYNNYNFMLMMMMVIYLFIALVAVVKVTNIFYGPLRTM